MRTILLDSNVFVLFLVGTLGIEQIAKHKNTQDYDAEDFEILAASIASFDTIATTPSVLAETSNLVRQIGDPAKSALTELLRRIIDRSGEVDVPRAEVVANPSFVRLGYTDAVLLALAGQSITVLTVDGRLHDAGTRAGLPITNFDHLKAIVRIERRSSR